MTVQLEHLADGSISDRNFRTLARLVPDTGGLSIRVRAGSVTAAGAVQTGTGFTATRNGVGDYTVTVGFASVPTVIVGAGETAAFYVAKLSALTPPSMSGFRVLCFNPSTLASVDGIFDWVAIG